MNNTYHKRSTLKILFWFGFYHLRDKEIEKRTKNLVFIEQYKSQDKEVRFDFYWLGGKEVKKQTNKISF